MRPVIKILLAAVVLLTAPAALAQIPRQLSYQGVLTDSAGVPKPDGSYTFTFRLFNVPSGGSFLWSESKPLEVRNGLFATLLGDLAAFPGSLAFDVPYWLSIEVSGIGELAPRLPVAAAGYSLNSLRADTARSVLTGGVGSAAILDGSIQFADIAPNGASSGQVMKWNGSAWAAAADNAGSDVWATNGSAISYTAGNVGVGDETPASTFTVGSGDKFQVSGTDGDVILTDDNATIRFPATALPNSPMMQMFSSGTANADRMVISHSPGFPTWGIEYKDTTDVLHLRDASQRRFSFELGSGDLGIGVENPSFPLDIRGRMQLRGTGTSSNAPGIWFTDVDDDDPRALISTLRSDSALGIYSPRMGRWAVQFEVQREPRIGVGMPPDEPVRSEIHLYHTNFGGSNDGVRIQNEGANLHYWNLYTSNTTGAFELYKQGIKRGTFDPTSGAYTALSDESVKQGIVDHADVLGGVMNLRLKSYEFKEQVQPGRRYSGFLAQELERVFPQFVFFGGDDQKLYTVDYAGLSTIALKAIQEQQATIDAQKSRIDELAREVQELKELIRNAR